MILYRPNSRDNLTDRAIDLMYLLPVARCDTGNLMQMTLAEVSYNLVGTCIAFNHEMQAVQGTFFYRELD
ncbi:hypothetical protein N9Y42_01340 [Mariniblastus sp.]|nr:hypothetical protein [Mariniblastus sp.]